MGIRSMDWHEWIEVKCLAVDAYTLITVDPCSWIRNLKSIIGSDVTGFKLMGKRW